MNHSLAADAHALALLGQLLDADDAGRAQQLGELEHTEPAVHARVLRLLHAAADASATQQLAAATALQLPWQPRAGDRVAGWRLLRELGRGGMATVWLAERADGSLKREVALKLPTAPQVAGVLAERFARERDVLASLDHPNIARLYDAGVDDGRPYIVLEAVHGLPVTEHADQHGLDRRARLQLALQVLAAVDHAHRHLVVHRDLKPHNILVDDEGQVKLLDFGIAKLLDELPDRRDLTLEAGTALTPRYAAPEQLLGRPATTATDVYAAGLVLHELLTGHLPHADAGDDGRPLALAERVRQVTQRPVPAPGLDRELDTVLLTALQVDPALRYATVERFADDLHRVLDLRPILARPVPAWRRLALLLRRHARVSLAAGVALLALLAAGALAWQQGRESAAQRQRADAVRAFVFAMVADAEPEQGQTDVSGREIVAAAVERARRELGHDPRLRGELLSELGRVSLRLQQVEPSVQVLGEALELLQRHAPADDPALQRTRAVLARALIGRDAQRATQLATQALQACTRDDPDCADARAYARYALAALASWKGDGGAALNHARAMVDETARAIGSEHPAMAQALETLATTARNAGETMEAASAVERAQALGQRAPMKAANRDRLDLLQALIDIELGRYAPARDRLQALLARPGTDLEHSIQWRVLTTAELGLGRPAAALAAADLSVKAAPSGAPQAMARHAWAAAAARAGRADEALGALDTARQGLLAAGFAPTSLSVRRIQLLADRIQVREGRAQAAQPVLQPLHDEPGDLPPAERVLVAEAWGCALTLSGRAAEARGAYQAAVSQLGRAVGPDHPTRLRLAAQLALLDGPAAAAAALQSLAAAWAPDSPLHAVAITDCRALL